MKAFIWCMVGVPLHQSHIFSYAINGVQYTLNLYLKYIRKVGIAWLTHSLLFQLCRALFGIIQWSRDNCDVQSPHNASRANDTFPSLRDGNI